MKAISMVLFLMSYLPIAVAADYDDVIFYNEGLDQQPAKCFYHLFNLFSRSLTQGLLVNGSRTGLGSKNPTGKKMRASGLYFQLINIVSLAELEFLRQLKQPNTGCLPDEIMLQTGAYAPSVIRSAATNDSELTDKINQAFELLFPGIQLIQLHAMPKHRLALSGSDALDAEARAGIDDKYRQINSINQADKNVALIDRLQALLLAYTPLTNQLHLKLPSPSEAGELNATVLLPAFHQFVTENFEDPNTWHLQKGQPLVELPIPIKISVINITHLSYLAGADLSQTQVIQTDINKQFDDPSQLSTIITFGRLSQTDGDSLVVDHSFDEDALVLRVNLASSPNPNDPLWIKGIKRQITLMAKKFTIDALIHKLGIDLTRKAQDPSADNRFEDVIFHPRFSQANSNISFRLQQDTNFRYERNNLTSLGFSCEQGTQTRWHCERYYRTWKGLYSSTLGGFVRFAVNSNIQNIEQALDEELSAVLDILLDKLVTTADTISDRLKN